jgi:hypothetical protein
MKRLKDELVGWRQTGFAHDIRKNIFTAYLMAFLRTLLLKKENIKNELLESLP